MYFKVIGGGNYNDIGEMHVDVTIAPKPVTITGLSVSNKVYDGKTDATVTGTAVIDGNVDGNNLTVVGGSAAFADKNVGTGKSVTFAGYALSGSAAGNYVLSAQPASVTADITKATLTVTAKPKTITYGDTPTNDGVEYSGFVTGEDEAVLGGELVYAYNYAQYGNVGEYTITPSGLTGDNYAITFVEGTLTVVAKKVTADVTTDPTSYVYDGTAKEPVVTVKDGEREINPSEYSVEYTNNVNVGTATVTITDKPNGNYVVSGFATFTITKATPDVTAPTPKTLTYDGTEQALVNAGETTGGTIEYKLGDGEYGEDIPKATDAGTYTLYYRVVGNDNYNDVAEASVTVTIAPKTVTATVTTNPTSYVYDGTAKEPVVTVEDGGTVIAPSEYTVSYSDNTDAGEATVTITDNDGGNYVVSGSAKFTITKATPAVTPPEAVEDLIYSGYEQALVSGGMTTGGELQYSLDGQNWSTGVPEATNAGEYTVYYRVVGGDNYNDVNAASVTVTIAPKTVTATVTTEQDSYVFDGNAKEPTVTVKDGDRIIDPSEYTVSYSNNTDAGTATITITDKEGGNYIVTGSTTFTITAAAMNVSAEGYSDIYDGLAHGIIVTAPEGASVTYRVNAEDEYSADNPAFKDVGSYTVYYKVTKANYSDVTGSATVVIEKAALKVTAKPKTITYGDAPANDGVTYEGFVNAETASVLGGALEFAYNYEQYGAVGKYVIAPSGLTSNNYEITYEKGELTVEQKVVGLEWSGTTLTYNGEPQAPVATATGLVNNDTCVVAVEGAKTDVGTYTATATALSNDNYKLPEATTASFTIINATMDGITVSGYTGTYDGQHHGISVTVPDGATVTYSNSADGTYDDALTYVNAGTYTVYYKVVKANYEEVKGSATVTINQKTVEITWSNTSFTYDGTEKCPTVTLSNVVEGDVCTAIVEGAQTNAGTYTATVKAVSNPNYTLPETNLTQEFTIAKAAQEAPDGVAGVPETYRDQGNGQITGVNASMEYRKEGEDTYTPVIGDTINDLPAGKYYVRYAETGNYNASPDTEVVIDQGDMITVTWKVQGKEDLIQQYVYGADPSYGDDPTVVPTAGSSYEFTGWDPEVTAVTGPVTYTAQFKLRNCLNIHRNAAAEQDFLYVIKGTSEGNSNVNTQVVLRKGEKDVYVVGLPDGDYTVTEVATWSWRVTPVNRMLTATFSADANRVTVTFGASSALTKWLNAFASVVNVITGTNG